MLRILIISGLLSLRALAFELPADSTQCVVGVSPNWNSSEVMVSCHEKQGGKWVKIHGPWPARLGKAGSAWGRGLHPVPVGAALKKEGDWKAPAGVFRIGGAWGYDQTIRKHPKLFYRQITPRDLWVEDSTSSSYNRHLILDHDPATPWERKQQMRQGDHAHSLKLFIAHNTPPSIAPGAGSAIFFHIWRSNGSKPTAGCTTLSEDRLRTMIAWIDPNKNPLYVLLPQETYDHQRKHWKLP